MRVLIVEDEPTIASQLAAALGQAGYAVDRADNGVDALALGGSEPVDAVILDLGLPRIDGLTVLKKWRGAGRTMPVLILTARDNWHEKVAGIDAGADDYLAKPFQSEELIARLRALIRRSAGQTHPAIAIGDLVLDTAARRACVAGAEIVLTAREYSLLEYLALHRGEVVSRTTLYEHLFDEDDDSLSNLLDVHVSNLRKKLGHDLIVTRRGLGYCIA